MDSRERSERRSPRRGHRQHEGDESGRHGRDRRRRDSRSRSPAHEHSRKSRHEHRSSHRHRDHSRRHKEAEVKVDLPFSARPLSKGDLSTFEALFAHYLSLQKQKEIEDMDDREVKGRWKSFVGKWNRGELAEGWYDPDMFQRITAMAPMHEDRQWQGEEGEGDGFGDAAPPPAHSQAGDEDEDYGPTLPASATNRRAGPGIPSLQDLSLRAELAEEEKQASINELRAERKADRALQKERLDDLTPRAEPGTRERQLEKRQMVNEKMREFRDRSPGMEAGNDKDLMGGGDDIQEYRRMKEQEQRRKTEREIRREELERAKMEEMEERRRAWREREEGTMGMLRELAKQRFG